MDDRGNDEGPELSTEPDIRQLQAELDRLYTELLTLTSLETDAALLRLATMVSWASGTRGRLSRSPGRSTARFLGSELEPFLSMLDVQARLVEKAVAIRRANRR